jgi:hypothetical protein
MTSKTRKSRRHAAEPTILRIDNTPTPWPSPPTNAPTPDPTPQDATNANVAQTNGKAPEEIQAAIDELVRRYGGNLRDWSEFPRVIAEAGLQPQDVTDERLAAASLRLHQRREKFIENIRVANADPANRLKVVIKGDPEFDLALKQLSPITVSEEENDMTEKKKGKRTTQAKGTKAAGAPKTETGKMSALDAAAKVLAEEGRPMTAKELIDAMAAKGYWTSPGGKTPHATLSAAIGTEINKKGAASRFAKPAPGKFALRAE